MELKEMILVYIFTGMDEDSEFIKIIKEYDSGLSNFGKLLKNNISDKLLSIPAMDRVFNSYYVFLEYDDNIKLKEVKFRKV